MLKIIIESDNSKEPAVEWVMDMLKFKGVGNKVRTAKMLRDGHSTYMTIFEKRK